MAYYYPPYVSASERQAKASREAKQLAGEGTPVSPVAIVGRQIASTFWGKAWCDNLESYSDFENRLPRGRSYLRNGSVVHLQIEPGKITSLVSGSHLYCVAIEIRPLQPSRWNQLQNLCGQKIGSVVELLQGRLSTSVMAIVTNRGNGLFPAPEEIEMRCSCPDWAGLCKHVAATLYGVGSRLDHSPELLFQLRQVDHSDLIAQAGLPSTNLKNTSRRTIASDALSDVFGIELETKGDKADSSPEPETRSTRKGRTTPAKAKAKQRAEPRKKQDAALQVSTRGTPTAKKRKRTQASDKRKDLLQQKELTGDVKRKPPSSRQPAKDQSAKSRQRPGKS